MALPPIITNAPLFKVLNGSPEKPASEPQAPAKSSAPKDSVTLSEDALKKLDSLKSDDLKTTDSARQTAGEVRASLEENPDLYLGPVSEDNLS